MDTGTCNSNRYEYVLECLDSKGHTDPCVIELWHYFAPRACQVWPLNLMNSHSY